jgi:hypothetical protein
VNARSLVKGRAMLFESFALFLGSLLRQRLIRRIAITPFWGPGLVCRLALHLAFETPDIETNPPRVVAVILTLAAFSSGWMLRAGLAVEAPVEADHKLSVVYKKLMAVITGTVQKEKLKAAQRAWLAWMVAEDACRTALDDNSKAGLFVRIELLEARAAQLESLLQNR